MIETSEAAKLIIFVSLVLGGVCLGICAKLATVLGERNKLAIENAHLKGMLSKEEPLQLANPHD